METTVCTQCGSTEFKIVAIKRRDFPPNIRFLQCSRCSTTISVVNAHNIGDWMRSGDAPTRKLADDVVDAMTDLHSPVE